MEGAAFFCHPAWWILYHVMISFKKVIHTGSLMTVSSLVSRKISCNVYIHLLFLQLLTHSTFKLSEGGKAGSILRFT